MAQSRSASTCQESIDQTTATTSPSTSTGSIIETKPIEVPAISDDRSLVPPRNPLSSPPISGKMADQSAHVYVPIWAICG